MTTTTLQEPPAAPMARQRSIVGAITGARYSVNAIGQVTVDTQDSTDLKALGWIPVASVGTGQANAGVATLDFGSFPGAPTAILVVVSQDVSDPNARIDVWVAPADTVDHTSDEHLADPPRVYGVNTTPGTSFTIYGFARGTDLPVPPGTPFGNATGSQMPVGQQQLMPYGKWNVAWAFHS